MSNPIANSHNQKPSNLIQIRVYQFSIDVIRLIRSFPDKRIYWSIGDQLLRSATSIGANITEAKSSSSKREFMRFYEIALKSANESKYWLSLLKDSELFKEDPIHKLFLEVQELCRMIAASLITMRKKKD